MKNKNSSLGTVLATAITVFISAIIIFALTSVFNIMQQNCAVPALVFAIINLIIICTIVICTRVIAAKSSVASYIQLAFATALYTLLQFVQLLLSASFWSVNFYILYHLVLLALWMIIAAAIYSIGRKSKKQDKENL
ncbi:MAG: hypothetical protein LBM65_07255 [Oscillospiraceae bacterium]|jgi:hypothetical protein|nr:hypothetical protein [Oscillospiraceae bacterium]